jgi:hypothetical protein
MTKTGVTTSFHEPRHDLEPLVRQYGNEEAAGQATESAVNAAFNRGYLIMGEGGLYRQVFDIGGNSVTVGGRVVDGAVRVGTAWIAS